MRKFLKVTAIICTVIATVAVVCLAAGKYCRKYKKTYIEV